MGICAKLMAAVVLLAGVAHADSVLYSQDFDAAGQAALIAAGAGGTASAPTGWTMRVNNANATNSLIVSDGSTVWGGAYAGYYATADSQDFALGYYPSSTGANNYIVFNYVAGSDIQNVNGSFDMELAWSRYDSGTARTGGFNNGFRYQINHPAIDARGYAWGTLLAGGLTASNANVASAADWLTDAEQDAMGLSRRNVQFSIPEALQAGDTLTLVWFGDYSSGSLRNMLVGVDNFELRGTSAAVVPLPAAAWAGAALLGGMGGVGALRRRLARRA